MLVNLCHSSLKPAIVCNKPTYDGYEINNLIQQTSYRNQGFMVERFIKPPVTITLKFPCNVEIFKICINPFVGRQKSLGFEVHTKSEVVKDSWLMNPSLTPSVNTDGIFVPVGRTLLKEAKTFCFRNYSFKGQREIPSTMLCQLELPLKHHQQKSLTFVSHVSLRITQTEGSSVPCIGKLEIWAKPVSNGVANLVSKVYSCFEERFLNDQVCETDTVNTDDFINQNATSSLPTNSNSFNLNGVDVPEDFLDPITCEIMTMPMLLPSGQSVDQSTLANYNNAESRWGRTPNNLFTSIKFTSTYKPVPNTSLKVRIDKFLLDNSQQLSDVPRTIGRASDIQNQGLSIENKSWVQPARLRADSRKMCSQTFLQHGNSSTKLKASCSSLNKHQNLAASSLNGHIKSHTKHENISNSFAQSRTTDGKNFQMLTPGLKRKTLSSSKTGDDVGNTAKRQQTSESARVIRDSHENDLNQSLEAALSRTLGTLPSFSTPVMNSKEIIVKKCAKCQISNEVHLYVLPCTHILCRNCLNSNYRNENGTMKYFCLQCKDSYNSKEIQRLYD